MELKKVFRNSGSAMASMRRAYSALIAAQSAVSCADSPSRRFMSATVAFTEVA